MTSERILEVTRMVSDDCEKDAKTLDGMPFCGTNVGIRLGEIYAMIKALADTQAALALAVEEAMKDQP
jgi:hypothetical protein